VSFSKFLKAQGYDPDTYLKDLLELLQGHSKRPVPRVSQLR